MLQTFINVRPQLRMFVLWYVIEGLIITRVLFSHILKFCVANLVLCFWDELLKNSEEVEYSMCCFIYLDYDPGLT
jgi:hypothetical protein